MEFTPKTFVRTYLPTSFHVENILPKDWWDYGRFVVGGLYLRRHTEKRQSPDDFFSINSQVLRDVLPRRDATAIMAGLKCGVIECDGEYRRARPGVPGKSFGYRLTDNYRHAEFRKYDITHRELVRKVNHVNRVKREALTNPIYIHLRSWVDRLEVAPGYPLPALPLVVIEDNKGSQRLSPCEQGRIHTPLTNLYRLYRRWLRLNGNPLWSIDIKNSQPLCLAMAAQGPLRREITNDYQRYKASLPKKKKRKTAEQSTDTKQDTQQSNQTNPLSTLYPYVVTFSEGGQNDDCLDFLMRCEDGSLYEELMKATGYDRAGCKRKFMAAAYGRPWHAGTKVGRAMEAAYPTIWNYVKEVNRTGRGALAREMQTVESYLVIHRACGRIMREAPTVPLLTLHDSLCTTADHLDYVANVLKDEFRECYGAAPALTKTPFADEQG